MNKRKVKLFSIIFISIILLTTTGAVYANGINGFLDWNGQSEIDEVTAMFELVVDEIEIMEVEIEVLVLEKDALIIERDQLLLEAIINQNTIDSLNLEIDGLEADILLLESEVSQLELDLQAMTDERDWLFDELTQANLDAENFRDGICTEVDRIRNPHRRAKFNTWCPQ